MSLGYKVLAQNLASDIAFNQETVVLLGANPSVKYSTNSGASWLSNNSISGREWYASIYRDNLFVAAANDGFVAYSTNGINWQEKNVFNNGEDLFDIAYGNGKFVVVSSGSSNYAHSSDGINWTQSSFTAPSGYNIYGVKAIHFANNKFVAISYGSQADNACLVMTSTDGVTWSINDSMPGDYYSSITYGNNVFVAATYLSNTFAYSTDAVTWTNASEIVNGPTSWYSIAFNGNVFVTVPFNPGAIAISTNGINWTLGQQLLSSYYYTAGITSINGKFYTAHMTSNNAYVSTNGVTWTLLTTPVSQYSTTIVSGDPDIFNPRSIYETPALKNTTLSSIYVANSGTASNTYDIAIVPSGSSLSDVNKIRSSIPLSPNDFHQIETAITLSEGDRVVTNAFSSEVTINIFGVEK